MTRLLLDIAGSPPSSGSPAQWAVIALGAVTILYVAVVRPMRKGKARGDPLQPRPGRAGLAQQRAVERDMANLLVEYEEMIRRMTAQVDTRAAKLELLIKDAEEVIARLKAALAAGDGGGTPTIIAAPSEAASRTRVGVAGGADSSVRSSGIAAVATAPPADKPGAESVDDAGWIDERHAAVYRLVDEGRSARQIAQELGRPYGEVELIIALRPNRPKQPDVWKEGNETSPDTEAPDTPDTPETTTIVEPGKKARKKQRSPGS